MMSRFERDPRRDGLSPKAYWEIHDALKGAEHFNAKEAKKRELQEPPPQLRAKPKRGFATGTLIGLTIGTLTTALSLPVLEKVFDPCGSHQAISATERYEQYADWDGAIAEATYRIRTNVCEEDRGILKKKLIEDNIKKIMSTPIPSDDIPKQEMVVERYKNVVTLAAGLQAEDIFPSRWELAHLAAGGEKVGLAAYILQEVSRSNNFLISSIPVTYSYEEKMRFVYQTWLQAGIAYSTAESSPYRLKGRDFLAAAAAINTRYKLNSSEAESLLRR